MPEPVLIVDDEELVLDAIIRTLKIEGIDCFGEPDPGKALEIFKATPPDVAIIDFVYDARPDITGLDLIVALRKAKPWARTILISGKIDHAKLDEETLKSSLRTRARCDHYLVKPFANEELIQVVNESLAQVETSASNWLALAKEYVQNASLEPQEIRDLNESIKEAIRRAIDEETGKE